MDDSVYPLTMKTNVKKYMALIYIRPCSTLSLCIRVLTNIVAAMKDNTINCSHQSSGSRSIGMLLAASCASLNHGPGVFQLNAKHFWLCLDGWGLTSCFAEACLRLSNVLRHKQTALDRARNRPTTRDGSVLDT